MSFFSRSSSFDENLSCSSLSSLVSFMRWSVTVVIWISSSFCLSKFSLKMKSYSCCLSNLSFKLEIISLSVVSIPYLFIKGKGEAVMLAASVDIVILSVETDLLLVEWVTTRNKRFVGLVEFYGFLDIRGLLNVVLIFR